MVTETALCLVLLICAALMVQSLARLRSVDPGFDPSGVAVVRVNVPESRYPEDEQISGFFQNVIDRVSTLPGVRLLWLWLRGRAFPAEAHRSS